MSLFVTLFGSRPTSELSLKAISDLTAGRVDFYFVVISQRRFGSAKMRRSSPRIEDQGLRMTCRSGDLPSAIRRMGAARA
jgi:hypothetical protein